MSDDKTYTERNTSYLEGIERWIKENLLQKGEYGFATLTVRVQDGNIQEVRTARDQKLMPVEVKNNGQEKSK